MVQAVSHRQLVAEEAAIIQHTAPAFATQQGISTSMAERQLVRGALYSLDKDWQAAYNTYAPEEVPDYVVAAQFLQNKSKANQNTFKNSEGETQAAFTVTSAQTGDVDYGLKEALLPRGMRALYETHAQLTDEEKGDIGLSDNVLHTLVDVYNIRKATIEKLESAEKLLHKETYSQALESGVTLVQSLQQDPLGTLDKIKDSAIEGVQAYVLTKYISQMQGNFVKASEADSEVAVNFVLGAATGYAGLKVAGKAMDVAQETANKGKAFIQKHVDDVNWPNGGPDMAVAGGPVGNYPDIPESTQPSGNMMAQMSDDGPSASGGAKTSTLLGSLSIKDLLEDYLKIRSEKIGTMSAEDLRELSKHELNAVERMAEIVKKDDYAFDVDAPLMTEAEFKQARVERGSSKKEQYIYDSELTWDVFQFQESATHNLQALSANHYGVNYHNQMDNLQALQGYLELREKAFENLGDAPASYRKVYEMEEGKLNDLVQNGDQVNSTNPNGLNAEEIVANRVNENLDNQVTQADVTTSKKDPEI